MSNILLSFGHGYSAQALAARLLAEGWRVIGTTRSPEKAESIRATGAEAVLWPPADPAALLGRATHLLSSVAPDGAPFAGGDPVLRLCGAAIRAAAARIAWAGYLSTTAVYGDRGGGEVDESSECRPSTTRGAARLAAERAWGETGLPLHVFRLAGIYGPGRGPFEKLRTGREQRVVKPGQVFNRIHVEDVAAVLAASLARPKPGIYNVCDDEAARPEDVLGHAARLLGLPVPPAVPFEKAELSPMARSFWAESKRVSNRRIREELGVRLRYPSYREGLAAILEAEGRCGPASPPAPLRSGEGGAVG